MVCKETDYCRDEMRTILAIASLIIWPSEGLKAELVCIGGIGVGVKDWQAEF